MVLASIAWSAKNLACDTASTKKNVTDTDGDGLTDVEEIAVYGTSPLLADTDGDGKSDYEEIVVRGFSPTIDPRRFNPRVADIPLLELQIASEPLVVITLTESNGESRTFTTTRSVEEINTVSVGASESIAWFDEATESLQENVDLSTTLSGETGVSATQAEAQEGAADDTVGAITVTLGDGASSTTSRSIGRTVSQRDATEVRLTFSNDQSRQIREAISQAESYSQSHDITASGGSLKLLVVLVNRGVLPVRVTNLELATSLVGPDGSEIPVANLSVDTESLTYQAYTIAVGESAGPVNFVRNFLSLETVSRLLHDIRGLVVRVGVYEFTNAENEAIAFDTEMVGARTATIVIDYGQNAPPERYFVATNLDPLRPGITAKRALEQILAIPFDCRPDRGLVSVRDLVAVDDAVGQWIVRHRHAERGRLTTTVYGGPDATPYDCERIVLQAGDVLRILWTTR